MYFGPDLFQIALGLPEKYCIPYKHEGTREAVVEAALYVEELAEASGLWRQVRRRQGA